MNPDWQIGIEKLISQTTLIEEVPQAVKKGIDLIKEPVRELRDDLIEIFRKFSQQEMSPEQVARVLNQNAMQMRSEVKYHTPDPRVDTKKYPYYSFSLNPIKLIADLAGWRPGPINRLWGGPRPIVNMFLGGAILAGLGYGLGAALENIFPSIFERGKLRNRAAIIGALIAALPPFIQWYARYKALNEKNPQEPFKNSLIAWFQPVFEKESKDFTKSSDNEDFFDPFIHTDKMERKIMEDEMTPITDRAIVASMLHTADVLSHPKSNWVSPFDVMQTAITLGSGVAQGYLIAKAVGALAGLTPQAEDKLKRLGIWAGAVSGIAQRLGVS